MFYSFVVTADIFILVDGLHGIFIYALLDKTGNHIHLPEEFLAFGILNFLSEQKTAVINGAAGTGKTMIAVEKAQRHATAGEKVLFLCYNTQLKNYLSENYFHENIDYYTISGLACKLCNTTTPNYEKMKSGLEDMYVFDNFPYMHIVIDEGQDSGIDAVEETGIIEVLKSIITDIKPDNASFYIFYDKLQLVQSRKIPQYISDADCKLTLYRNCRNTENIATTSFNSMIEYVNLFNVLFQFELI